MKKRISVAIVCLIGVLLLGIIFYSNNAKHPFKTTEDFTIEIKEGDTLYSVIEILKREKKLKNPTLVKLYIKQKKLTPNIKPGSYSITKDASVEEFISMLEDFNLDKSNIKVTIPEGYDIDKIAVALEEADVITKDEFIAAVKEYKLPSYIKTNDERKYDLEGFLFPDTYGFKKGVSGEEIIKTMNGRFDEVMKELTKEKPLNDEELYNIITMASIVERETSNPKERDIVASVFYNRIKEDMKFQSCATVLYALGKHKDKLYEKDLEVDSPYNTYLVKGLPVGPISSPGREAIKAAINPAETNYLFFVSNNDGTHFFTDDYEEFLKVKGETQGF